MISTHSDKRILFVSILGLLSVFYAGHLYTSDTVCKIESMRNALTRGTFAVESASGAWGSVGVDGRTYPHFTIGAVLNTLPGVVGGLAVGTLWPRQKDRVTGAVVTATNLLYTAGIAVLLFVLLSQWGCSRQRAALSAIIGVLATAIFPYSKTCWSEPAVLFWGLLGLAALGSSRPWLGSIGSSRRWAAWAVCSGVASLIRVEFACLAGLFLLVSIVRDRRIGRPALVATGVLAMMLLPHLAYNALRYGSMLDFGYTDAQLAGGGVTGILRALMGADARMHAWWFLCSFGKVHWFWSSPLLALVVLVPVQWKRIPEQGRRVFLAAAFFSPVYVYLIATSLQWCTTWCWGYRYFLVCFPFLLLPLPFVIWDNRRVRAMATGLALCGVMISLMASLVNYHVVLERLVARYGYEQTMWGLTQAPWHAPFWEHVRLFPAMAAETLRLAVSTGTTPAWETLRVTCLDIWPVGLVAAGVPARLAFGAWLVLLIGVAIWWARVALPHFELLPRRHA